MNHFACSYPLIIFTLEIISKEVLTKVCKVVTSDTLKVPGHKITVFRLSLYPHVIEESIYDKLKGAACS